MSPTGPSDIDSTSELQEALSDAPTDERVYRVALQLNEPTRIAAVADRASCAPDTARRHLQRLAEIGLVQQVTESPATYQRNESYFEWRRRQRLAELPQEVRESRLETLITRDQRFQERYESETPATVDALDHVDHDELDEAWQDLSEWQTIRERIERLEAVRRERTSESHRTGCRR